MSILKIIAILGIVLGLISCVMETRKTGKRYMGIFAGLIIASAILFVIAGQAEDKFAAVAAEKAQLAAADTPQAVEAVDAGDPQALAANTEENAAPEAAPENAQESNDDEFDLTDVDLGADGGDNGEAKAPANDEGANPVADDKPAEENAPVAADNAAPAQPEPAPAPAPAPAAAPAAGAITANAGADIESAKIKESIAFSAKSSKIPKGNSAKTYAWDFGDGESTHGRDVKHAYREMGKYTATLTITDAAGRTSTATRSINVDRPENKIKLGFKALDDQQSITVSPSPFTSSFKKSYPGTKLIINASGYILAEDGAKCELIVSLDGPGCNVSNNKVLENGGEGDITLKTQCKGEPGDFNWTVTRKVQKGTCTFTSIKVDVSEN